MIKKLLITLILGLTLSSTVHAQQDSIYDYPFDFNAPQSELQNIQKNFINEAQPQVLGDSTFRGETCPASQTLTQNLRTGARNGTYHPYTRGVVTQANILQGHLNRLGFNSGISDGIIGTNTDGAIKRMQAYLGVKADGIVGPQTRAALNQSCGISNVADSTTPTPSVSSNPDTVSPLSARTQENLSLVTNLSFSSIQERIKALREGLLLKKEESNTITSAEKRELETIKKEDEKLDREIQKTLELIKGKGTKEEIEDFEERLMCTLDLGNGETLTVYERPESATVRYTSIIQNSNNSDFEISNLTEEQVNNLCDDAQEKQVGVNGKTQIKVILPPKDTPTRPREEIQLRNSGNTYSNIQVEGIEDYTTLVGYKTIDTAVKIGWSTSAPSHSYIEYGTTPNLGSIAFDQSRVPSDGTQNLSYIFSGPQTTNHAVGISGL